MGYEVSAAWRISSKRPVALARQGYAKTSLMDIAREAGMSKGAVHYHFPTKESWIGQVLQRPSSTGAHTRSLGGGQGLKRLDTLMLEELRRLRAQRTDEAIIVADLPCRAS